MSFLKSFSFRKFLYNKRYLVPLSILLSFVLWIVITVNAKPTIDRSFSDMTVTVNMENTFAAENKMNIVSDISDQRFTVLVMGPKNIVSALTAKDISLYASAAEVDSPGEYDIAVSATSTDYDIISITPKTIKVSFDYMETKDFTVEALAEGAAAADGLVAEAATVSGVEGGIVTITGPRTVINSIASVKAVAKVNKTLSQSETFDGCLVIYDEQENVIEGKNLQYSIDKIKVTVPISKSKTVPVKVDYSNTPKGFDKSSINATVNYSEVTVIGTPDAVDKISAITLDPIDITTLTAKSQEFNVKAKLPEGIRLLDAIESFNVKINLSSYREIDISVNNLKFTGLSTSLTTGAAQPIKNVKICGPASVIRRFKASSAYAEINLTDKKAGKHALGAVISFEGYNNIWAIGTYQTEVEIK